MANHPNRKKIAISELPKGSTIKAMECRRKIRVGGLEEYEWHEDWQTGWYLDSTNVIRVGLSYKGRVISDHASGGGKSGGLVQLQESDWSAIEGPRDGSPDELKTRKQRERRERHETLLWRIEKAQAAVDLAVKQDKDADLEAIAEDAFYS